MVTAELEEYSYSLRWIFDDDEQHELNAKTLLKSEQALISFIYDIAKQFEFSLEIKVSAREEGSLKSRFKIFWQKNKDQILISTIPSVIAIVLTAFFSQLQEPKSTDLEREKFVIELQEKVNNGTLTQEQVETYIENFSSISKYKTAFFKANKADKEVSGIEVEQEGTVTATIPSEDFDNYIFQKQKNDTIIQNAKVYIISPVLVAGIQEKWTGKYEGENIRFYVKDKEFLEKSQNKVISFNTGFFIICEIRKITNITDGKEKIIWEISEVTNYGTDEEHIFKHNTSRNTKNKVVVGQLSLFSE